MTINQLSCRKFFMRSASIRFSGAKNMIKSRCIVILSLKQFLLKKRGVKNPTPASNPQVFPVTLATFSFGESIKNHRAARDKVHAYKQARHWKHVHVMPIPILILTQSLHAFAPCHPVQQVCRAAEQVEVQHRPHLSRGANICMNVLDSLLPETHP